MKYGLAIHTSSPALGLAIGSNTEDVRCQTWDLGRDTSNYLHPYLQDFLRPHTWQDLGWIAVANGPGGFTGTRLGVVTARTLGQQLDIPVFAISSLAAIAKCCLDRVAWQSPQVCSLAESPLLGRIAVSMPAQRGEVFAAVFKISNDDRMQTILPETVFLAADWDAQLAGYQPMHHIIVPQSANLTDTVVGVLALARKGFDCGERPHWSTALPFYGQHPVISAAISK